MQATDSAMQSMLRDIDLEYLKPSDRNVRKQRERAEALIRVIHSGPEDIFRVKEFKHHGSLSRGTGLRDFDDWDSILILDGNALQTRRGTRRTPSSTLGLLAAAIESRYAGMVQLETMTVRRQAHSVGVIYPKSGFRVDLVPGLTFGGRLHIPDRGSGTWIRTRPDEARERVKTVSIIAPGTISAIRLLKSWSRTRGKRKCALPSFAIETYVVDRMSRERLPLEQIVLGFIERLAEASIRYPLTLLGEEQPGSAVTLIDPLSQTNLTTKITAKQKSTIIKTARESMKNVNAMWRALDRGKSAEATRLARALFIRKPR